MRPLNILFLVVVCFMQISTIDAAQQALRRRKSTTPCSLSQTSMGALHRHGLNSDSHSGDVRDLASYESDEAVNSCISGTVLGLGGYATAKAGCVGFPVLLAAGGVFSCYKVCQHAWTSRELFVYAQKREQSVQGKQKTE